MHRVCGKEGGRDDGDGHELCHATSPAADHKNTRVDRNTLATASNAETGAAPNTSSIAADTPRRAWRAALRMRRLGRKLLNNTRCGESKSAVATCGAPSTTTVSQPTGCTKMSSAVLRIHWLTVVGWNATWGLREKHRDDRDRPRPSVAANSRADATARPLRDAIFSGDSTMPYSCGVARSPVENRFQRDFGAEQRTLAHGCRGHSGSTHL